MLNRTQFPVLSDEEGVAARTYDIGRGFFGLTALARVTFVVDKKGIIRCVPLVIVLTGSVGSPVVPEKHWTRRSTLLRTKSS